MCNNAINIIVDHYLHDDDDVDVDRSKNTECLPNNSSPLSTTSNLIFHPSRIQSYCSVLDSTVASSPAKTAPSCFRLLATIDLELAVGVRLLEGTDDAVLEETKSIFSIDISSNHNNNADEVCIVLFVSSTTGAANAGHWRRRHPEMLPIATSANLPDRDDNTESTS